MSGLPKLSKAEEALIDAVRRGEEIDLARFSTDGKGKALIRAEVLRDLILQENGWQVHQRGVRFRNARICDQLDLSHCSVDFPLVMRECEFGDEEEWEKFVHVHTNDDWQHPTFLEAWATIAPLNIDCARLHFLQLDGSTFHGGLMAENAHTETDLFVANCIFTGPVMLCSARVGGILATNDAKFKNKNSVAINAQGIEIAGNCILRKAEFSSTCFMSGAKIGGQLSAEEAKFQAQNSQNYHAFHAQRAEIKESAIFRSEAKFTKFNGEVYLVGAKLGGLFMEGAKLTAQSNGVALQATNCVIDGDCWLKDGFSARGAVIFDRAELKGELSLSNARLQNQKITWNQFLLSFTMHVPTPDVIPAKAGIHAESAPAPEDAGEAGRTNDHKRPSNGMPQGRMDSRFRGNDDGKEESSVLIAFSFIEGKAGRLIMPEEEPPRGIVDLTRIHVGTLEDFEQGWPGGNGNAAEEHLVLDGFTYDHLRNPAGRPERDGEGSTDEIVRAREEWLKRQKPEHLEKQFRPQPWTQLIRALRRNGYREAAQEMDIRLRRKLRQTQMHRHVLRLSDTFLDLVAEYGYNPWRAVLISIFMIVAFTSIWQLGMAGCAEEGCRDESVFVRTKVAEYTLKPARDGAAATYPDFNPLGFSFDVFIPLFNFGYQDTWGIQTGFGKRYAVPPAPCWGRTDNGTPDAEAKCRNILKVSIPWGGILYLLYLLEIFLGAIMVAVIVAGFTGLLSHRRKEE